MLAAGLLSLMVTWWSSPDDTLNANRFASTVFDSALHRADWLRGVRLRARRDGGVSLATHGARDGDDLVVFIAVRFPSLISCDRD